LLILRRVLLDLLLRLLVLTLRDCQCLIQLLDHRIVLVHQLAILRRLLLQSLHLPLLVLLRRRL